MVFLLENLCILIIFLSLFQKLLRTSPKTSPSRRCSKTASLHGQVYLTSSAEHTHQFNYHALTYNLFQVGVNDILDTHCLPVGAHLKSPIWKSLIFAIFPMLNLPLFKHSPHRFALSPHFFRNITYYLLNHLF